jgi:hypothetical protein
MHGRNLWRGIDFHPMSGIFIGSYGIQKRPRCKIDQKKYSPLRTRQFGYKPWNPESPPPARRSWLTTLEASSCKEETRFIYFDAPPDFFPTIFIPPIIMSTTLDNTPFVPSGPAPSAHNTSAQTPVGAASPITADNFDDVCRPECKAGS